MAAEVIEQMPANRQPAISDDDWYTRTECDLRTSTDIMGGELAFGKRQLTDEEAYQISAFCAKCLVRSDCLADALLQDDKYGIRGGMNGAQRKRYAKILKRDGHLDDESWSQALGEAETTRRSFLAKSKPQPAAATPKRSRPHIRRTAAEVESAIRELLEDLPNQAYIGPENGSIFDELAADLGMSAVRARAFVGQLSQSGVVEKMFNGSNYRVTALRLVS